jgi:hypothetical protein
MDKQRVPNLQEMDEQEAYSFLSELFSTLSPEEVYEANHPKDYVMEMPQSGELVRGRENMRRFQEAYPNSPSIRLRRVLIRDGLWVAEVVNDYGGGQVYDVAMILELKDGRIWRDRRYYAEPFEAPEWRAQWVERMEVWASYSPELLRTRRIGSSQPKGEKRVRAELSSAKTTVVKY